MAPLRARLLQPGRGERLWQVEGQANYARFRAISKASLTGPRDEYNLLHELSSKQYDCLSLCDGIESERVTHFITLRCQF